MARKTDSDAPVAAREELEARDPDTTDNLEETAKEQEKEQRDALKSSLPGGDKSKEVAEAPAAVRGATGKGATQGGFMDQMSRRSGNDALEGHYVTIDLNYKGVADIYESLGLTDKAGNYGIYTEVGSIRDDGTGIPETAVVRLRDATHSVVTVPYEALSPAEARGR